jgi:hypothetical protein
VPAYTNAKVSIPQVFRALIEHENKKPFFCCSNVIYVEFEENKTRQWLINLKNLRKSCEAFIASKKINKL